MYCTSCAGSPEGGLCKYEANLSQPTESESSRRLSGFTYDREGKERPGDLIVAASVRPCMHKSHFTGRHSILFSSVIRLRNDVIWARYCLVFSFGGGQNKKLGCGDASAKWPRCTRLAATWLFLQIYGVYKVYCRASVVLERLYRTWRSSSPGTSKGYPCLPNFSGS